MIDRKAENGLTAHRWRSEEENASRLRDYARLLTGMGHWASRRFGATTATTTTTATAAAIMSLADSEFPVQPDGTCTRTRVCDTLALSWV